MRGSARSHEQFDFQRRVAKGIRLAADKVRSGRNSNPCLERVLKALNMRVPHSLRLVNGSRGDAEFGTVFADLMDDGQRRHQRGILFQEEVNGFPIQKAAVFDRVRSGAQGSFHAGRTLSMAGCSHPQPVGLLDDGLHLEIGELLLMGMVPFGKNAARGAKLDDVGSCPKLFPHRLATVVGAVAKSENGRPAEEFGGQRMDIAVPSRLRQDRARRRDPRALDGTLVDGVPQERTHAGSDVPGGRKAGEKQVQGTGDGPQRAFPFVCQGQGVHGVLLAADKMGVEIDETGADRGVGKLDSSGLRRFGRQARNGAAKLDLSLLNPDGAVGNGTKAVEDPRRQKNVAHIGDHTFGNGGVSLLLRPRYRGAPNDDCDGRTIRQAGILRRRLGPHGNGGGPLCRTMAEAIDGGETGRESLRPLGIAGDPPPDAALLLSRGETISRGDDLVDYGSMSGTYHQKGFGLKLLVQGELDRDFNRNGIVHAIQERGGVWEQGGLELHLAAEFGFCYGVDRTVQYAYETRARFQDRPIYIADEIIHNPMVNERLVEMGMKFLRGRYSCGKRIEDLGPGDVVIVTAFGAEVEWLARIRERGCVVVDTTCGSVLNVWKNVERYAREGITAVVHGKRWHEETKATLSHVTAKPGGRFVVVKDLEEARLVADAIRGRNHAAFQERLGDACSPGFDPSRDLDRIGLANQTTMLCSESLEIEALLRQAMIDRYGEKELRDRFRSFDTICSATQDRQDAVIALLERSKPQRMLVVGGFNSSNTCQLARIAAAVTTTFHIEGPADLERDAIRCRDPRTGQIGVVRDWLPTGQVRVGITAGASTPNAVLGSVIERLYALRGVKVAVTA